MLFTYNDYYKHIELLRKYNYEIRLYEEPETDKQVILRLDIDNSIEIAQNFAEFEHSIDVRSTYFVLLRTNLYNPFSSDSVHQLKKIQSLGHSIGLHFDEKSYSIHNFEELSYRIHQEISILEQIIDAPVKSLSMHRPSEYTLKGNFQFDGLINSYSSKYFKEYKYISDSRMHWREDSEQTITCGRYNKLHILTHPIWYSTLEETTHDKLYQYIKNSQLRTFNSLAENFKNIEEFVRKDEFL